MLLLMIQIRKCLAMVTILASTLIPLSVHAEIVASIKPIAFIVDAVADGVTPTTVLLPNYASPHNFSLRPSDILKIHNADLIVWVGPDLETFLQKPLAQMPTGKQLNLTEVRAIQNLMLSRRDDHPHDEDEGDEHHHDGDMDMHIWLSPEIAKQIAIAVHQTLLKQKPEFKEKLDRNLAEFIKKLTQTELEIKEQLSTVRNREYFVFHDGYQYLEKAFAIKLIGYFTVNPTVTPGAKQIYQIKNLLLQHENSCIMMEPQFRSDVINTLLKDVKVKKGILDPLGIDISTSKDSYILFLQQLTKQIMDCLQ